MDNNKLQTENKRLKDFLISLHGDYSDKYDTDMNIDELILKAKWGIQASQKELIKEYDKIQAENKKLKKLEKKNK